ncbi:MAG: hypothetical protein WCV85_03020 [Patescibacteria group bacterium]|jgi:hypothetical protein
MRKLYLLLSVSLLLLIGAACTKQVATTQNQNSSALVNTAQTNENPHSANANAQVVSDTHFLTADVLPVNLVGQISKFRSGSGHDFNDGTETCRSMKHYLDPKTRQLLTPDELLNEKYPATVPVYSPTTGTIREIQTEQFPLGKQIHIAPGMASDYNIRLFHIYPLATLKVGDNVAAGQQIGTIKAVQGFDIAVEKFGAQRPSLLSMFEVMNEQQLAAWAARGVTPANAIISKAARDADSLTCNGEAFTTSQENAKDWVKLK